MVPFGIRTGHNDFLVGFFFYITYYSFVLTVAKTSHNI